MRLFRKRISPFRSFFVCLRASYFCTLHENNIFAKMNATKTILDWKNVVWLSLVSYALYTTLWLVIDDEIWHAPGQFSVTEMAVDFCMCVLFVGFSLLYSRTSLRILPMRNRPYVRLLLMVCILFLLNNAMAYAMTVLCDAIWGDGSDELFRMQGIYTYGMVATFVSCIYSNAFYLETYMHTENEKRRLEIALLKEQEVALQSQLDALKSQIDTHFMFNNFSILAELIEEDRVLAGKFLANLSKVYRYIIQNMKRHKVPVGEEIAFLDAYLYLIEMRYGKAVVVHIENDVRIADGSIPPACNCWSRTPSSTTAIRPRNRCISISGARGTIYRSATPLHRFSLRRSLRRASVRRTSPNVTRCSATGR